MDNKTNNIINKTNNLLEDFENLEYSLDEESFLKVHAPNEFGYEESFYIYDIKNEHLYEDTGEIYKVFEAKIVEYKTILQSVLLSGNFSQLNSINTLLSVCSKTLSDAIDRLYIRSNALQTSSNHKRSILHMLIPIAQMKQEFIKSLTDLINGYMPQPNIPIDKQADKPIIDNNTSFDPAFLNLINITNTSQFKSDKSCSSFYEEVKQSYNKFKADFINICATKRFDKILLIESYREKLAFESRDIMKPTTFLAKSIIVGGNISLEYFFEEFLPANHFEPDTKFGCLGLSYDNLKKQYMNPLYIDIRNAFFFYISEYFVNKTTAFLDEILNSVTYNIPLNHSSKKTQPSLKKSAYYNLVKNLTYDIPSDDTPLNLISIWHSRVIDLKNEIIESFRNNPALDFAPSFHQMIFELQVKLKNVNSPALFIDDIYNEFNTSEVELLNNWSENNKLHQILNQNPPIPNNKNKHIYDIQLTFYAFHYKRVINSIIKLLQVLISNSSLISPTLPGELNSKSKNTAYTSFINSFIIDVPLFFSPINSYKTWKQGIENLKLEVHANLIQLNPNDRKPYLDWLLSSTKSVIKFTPPNPDILQSIYDEYNATEADILSNLSDNPLSSILRLDPLSINGEFDYNKGDLYLQRVFFEHHYHAALNEIIDFVYNLSIGYSNINSGTSSKVENTQNSSSNDSNVSINPDNTTAAEITEYINDWINCDVTLDQWLNFRSKDILDELRQCELSEEELDVISQHMFCLYNQLVDRVFDNGLKSKFDNLQSSDKKLSIAKKDLALIEDLINGNINTAKAEILKSNFHISDWEKTSLHLDYLMRDRYQSDDNHNIHSKDCYYIADVILKYKSLLESCLNSHNITDINTNSISDSSAKSDTQPVSTTSTFENTFSKEQQDYILEVLDSLLIIANGKYNLTDRKKSSIRGVVEALIENNIVSNKGINFLSNIIAVKIELSIQSKLDWSKTSESYQINANKYIKANPFH